MSNGTKIIFLATIFNLSFEYSMRGIQGILDRGLVFFLFLLYFSYYAIVEDLILRYRITNKQMVIVGFTFGLVPQTFITGVIFEGPLLFGVNIGRLIFIGIVWWGILQGLITFYFATRLVHRNWDRTPMGRLGWILSLGYILFFTLVVFSRAPGVMKGPGIGYLVSLLLLVLGLLYLFRALGESQQAPYPSEEFTLLKTAAYGTIIVFLLLGTFIATPKGLTQGTNLNVTAMRLSLGWSVVVFLAVLVHYWRNRCQVPV